MRNQTNLKEVLSKYGVKSVFTNTVSDLSEEKSSDTSEWDSLANAKISSVVTCAKFEIIARNVAKSSDCENKEVSITHYWDYTKGVNFIIADMDQSIVEFPYPKVYEGRKQYLPGKVKYNALLNISGEKATFKVLEKVFK